MFSHGRHLASYFRISRTMSSRALKTSNPLPATFLRGGTSKGIFLKRDTLPSDQADWDPIFLGIMGSPDPEHGRQLNGMGGGVSSLSKIVVVGAPSDEVRKAHPGVDIEYTFVQVGIRDTTIDYSGNCGNLSSVVGVFAVDEDMCKPRIASGNGWGTVQAFNTNTKKLIETTFPIDEYSKPVLDVPQAEVAGVPGKASRIDLDFIAPAGARTGKLLPTGNPIDIIKFRHNSSDITIQASLVDATNPSVFVSSEELCAILRREIDFHDTHVLDLIEAIRRAGASSMGLDPLAQAQPKIALLSNPSSEGADVDVHAFSMAVLHRAVPMTLGLCLGVASHIPGTLAWDIVHNSSVARKTSDLVRIKHPSGVVDVGAVFSEEGDVLSAKVVRTGRRLMKGFVWW